MEAQEPFNVHAQRDAIYKEQSGTGNQATTKWEWATSIHRDTLASHLGHHSRLLYFSSIQNLSICEIKDEFKSRYILPVGLPEKGLKKE